MAKVKLDLQNKNYEELDTFATAHQAAMNENPNFLTPSPSEEVYSVSLSNYSAKLVEIAEKELELKELRAQRDEFRTILEGNLNGRGLYVQDASGGSEPKILSAAFDVQSERTTTTSMPKPYDLSATMGDNPGEIDVSCHGIPKSQTFIYERREHSDVDVPGEWVQMKIISRSSATIGGGIPGMKYGFRIRVVGPNELESPWSDEVICMAP